MCLTDFFRLINRLFCYFFSSSGCGIVIQAILLAFLVSLVCGTCRLPSLFPPHQSNPTTSQRQVVHLKNVLNVSGVHTPHRKRAIGLKFSNIQISLRKLCAWITKKWYYHERCNPIECSAWIWIWIWILIYKYFHI